MSEINQIFSPPFLQKDGWTASTSKKPSPEFWSAAKLDPQTGETVLQLGVKPHARTKQTFTASVSAGFSNVFKLEVGKVNLFQGHFEPHRITVHNNGAKVTTTAYIGCSENVAAGRLVSFTPLDTATYFTIPDKSREKVQVFWSVAIEITFTGDQTATAEILARFGPFQLHTLTHDTASAAAADAKLPIAKPSSRRIAVPELVVPDASGKTIHLPPTLRKEI